MTSATPQRITVLAGGPSPEREISLRSGQAIAAALTSAGFTVQLRDIHPDDLAALDEPVDVIFPALHGTFGEDGELQAILDYRGLCYVGSGADASRRCIDKIATKEALRPHGFRMPWHVFVERSADLDFALSDRLVVKPVDQGSSVATTIVISDADLNSAADDVCARFGRAMVEQYITGDELTVGVVGGQALPVICVRPRRAFYDYQAKYESGDTEYLFDTGLTPEQLDQLQAASRRACEILGCRHLARVDWIVDRAGTFWFLEVNTMPGFTDQSLLPKAAAQAGLTFETLCSRLIELAWEDCRAAAR